MDSNSVQNGVIDDNATGRYAPGSAEDKLLKLDAESSKKALHQSRTLKRLGVVLVNRNIVSRGYLPV